MSAATQAHWFTELFERYQHDPAYVVEELKLALVESLEGTMERQGISRSELARRLGTSPAYVTKLLRGTFNPTLETIARLAIALDARLALNLVPRSRTAETGPLHVAEPTAKYGRKGGRKSRR